MALRKQQVSIEETEVQTKDSLGFTVGNFANRIRRKLKEQEERDQQSQRDSEVRHTRMLQAMTSIRKVLQDTCKIKLGSRFELELDITDWEGWPRLNLNLIDAYAPQVIEYSLMVTAHDRKETGSLEFRMRSGALLGLIELRQSSDFERIPLCLKKAVRAFLDLVAAYVLSPVKSTEMLKQEAQTAAFLNTALDPTSDKLSSENVFSDDEHFARENRIIENSEINRLHDSRLEAEDQQVLAAKIIPVGT